jgi:hypothetical protein
MQELNAEIARLIRECKLDSWNIFISELRVPGDLIPALMAGRAELVNLAQPRAMSAEEVADLYTLIATLLGTNIALRDHAEELSVLVKNWMSQFAGLKGVADQIDHFANFRRFTDSED